MAGSRDLTYKIGVDSSQGVAGVKQFSSAVKKELKSIEGDFDDTATAGQKVANVLSLMAKELDDELGRASAAADALATALGPELAAKADVGQIITDLNRMGLTFEDIVADADKLGASLKEMDAVQMKGLDSGLGGVKTKFGEIDDSVRGSRSVLANMVGNATQDLGALGGIAGSAGVAIGQMGEYMADATLNGQGLRSVVGDFVKVAGPVAALTAAIGVTSAVIGEFRRESEEAEERTKALGDAMKDTADDSLGFADVLREDEKALRDFTAATNDPLGTFGVGVDRLLGKIPLVGGVFNDAEQDIVSAAGRAGVSIYDLAKQIEDGGKVGGEFTKQLLDALAAGKITEAEYAALNEMIGKYADSAADAREMTKLFNVDQAELNALLKEMLLQEDPLSRFGDKWKIVMEDMADGTIDTKEAADAANFLAEQLGKEVPEVLAIAGQAWDDNKAAVEDWADATRAAVEESKQFVLDYADAIKEAALNVAETEGDLRDLAGTFEQLGVRQDALGALFDLKNAPLDAKGEIRDIELAIRDLSDVAKDIDLSKGLDRLKADPVLDAIDALRPQIQSKITDAFSAGGPQAARVMALEYIAKVADELGISSLDAAKLLGLEDLEALIHVAIEQTSLANAQAQLALLTGLPGADPLYAASIQLALDAGTITPKQAQLLIQDALGAAGVEIPAPLVPHTKPGAMRRAREALQGEADANPVEQPLEPMPTGLPETWAAVQDYYDKHPATIPVKPVIGDYVYPAGLIPGGGGGGGGGAGLLSASPMAAGVTPMAGPTLPTLMLPVAAPARAQAPTVNVYQTFQAGVIGAPYDVAQAVEDANRRLVRLMPVRP